MLHDEPTAKATPLVLLQFPLLCQLKPQLQLRPATIDTTAMIPDMTPTAPVDIKGDKLVLQSCRYLSYLDTITERFYQALV